ncbi:type I-E CRISPR-associated protein Cas6/Cse3/CasE [Methanocalculus sp.]|uniref:type I-E CRISPR-associated protein Cas6/Cse3/CasE n=1 Tax=Methanocalculus sp. TaxID=2004547 RepID=UPI002632332A|nr:type I-E CRISPR-associated protein Cas6/Cse3/CasE [Methanocalculus sp.]MDG6249203.1 type I-E CRISPR-associated protein Cas6/Cse3/CasE [Methanocalculus sp.]
MSRITLKVEATENRDFWRSFGGEYHAHNLIWSLFTDGPDRERDFLYRQELAGNVPTFFSVSEREPVNRGGMWLIESKEYAPILREGQRFNFVLKANPVRTKADEKGGHHRHDVVMNAKKRLQEDLLPASEMPSQQEIIQEAGFAWLASRSEKYGFSVLNGEVRADGYRQMRFYKKKGKRPIQISTIDYTGLLTVTEPEAFLNALFTGVGSAKGFGCGMIMIRPAR